MNILHLAKAIAEFFLCVLGEGRPHALTQFIDFKL